MRPLPQPGEELRRLSDGHRIVGQAGCLDVARFRAFIAMAIGCSVEDWTTQGRVEDRLGALPVVAAVGHQRTLEGVTHAWHDRAALGRLCGAGLHHVQIGQAEGGEQLGDAVGYTTVLKFMQIMTEKGLLSPDRTVRPQIFKPVQTMRSTQRRLVRDLQVPAAVDHVGGERAVRLDELFQVAAHDGEPAAFIRALRDKKTGVEMS